jgi:protein-tyrosine phosphatase
MDRNMKAIAILFVCMGNICRSPLAEGIMTHLGKTSSKAGKLTVASAGTGGWHVGDPPDRRSVSVARSHGIDISHQSAAQIKRGDFSRFDLILAMDEQNLSVLQQVAPAGMRHKLHLFSEYASGIRRNIPDPYYGGEEDFLAVYNMLFADCTSLLAKIGFDRIS